MTLQGDTCAAFRLSLTVNGGGIEIVQTVLDGVIHLFVDHILIELVVVVYLRRQAHHAIAQEGYFLFGLGVLAVGHLTYRRLHLILIFLCGLLAGLVTALAACQRRSSSHTTGSKHLQKRTP